MGVGYTISVKKPAFDLFKQYIGSPAGPAAFLLYGILFGFAATSYMSVPWKKIYTLGFYSFVLMWATSIVFLRKPSISFRPTRIDMLFGMFLFLVLASALTHWWDGTLKYIYFIPLFFVLPYLLGRLMNDGDTLLFMDILLMMGACLFLLIPIEYSKAYLPYVDWPAPYLFSQGHGVMLSGLLLSATFLVLVSRLQVYGNDIGGVFSVMGLKSIAGLYLAFGFTIILIAWISARGSAIAATAAMVISFAFSSHSSFRRKAAITLAFVTFVFFAAINPLQNKYSKVYYSNVIQPPVVFLSSDSIATGFLGRGLIDRSSENEVGTPILGERACASVKDSISDRWVHYQTALAIFISSPLVGVGANRYGHYSCTGPGWFPHSTTLQVMAELGLLGAVLYGLLILAACSAILKNYFSSGDVTSKVIAGWLLAYSAFHLLTSQLYGNYFMSAGLYFVIGISSRLEVGRNLFPVKS